MDGGATATEHLLGMIDDSGGTRGAGPPSGLSGSRCGVDRAAQPEEDPAGLRDEGLAACAGGGWPFGAHQPKHLPFSGSSTPGTTAAPPSPGPRTPTPSSPRPPIHDAARHKPAQLRSTSAPSPYWLMGSRRGVDD